MLLVELVDDDDAGLVGAVAMLPSNFCADGQVAVWPDHHDRAFSHPEAAEHLAREIEESGSVEDVDLEAAMLGEAHAEVDRDLAPLFFGLEVHGRGLLVGRAKARYSAGGEEHGLRQRGLAVVRVTEQDDVPDLFRRVISGHPTPNLCLRQVRTLSLKRD